MKAIRLDQPQQFKRIDLPEPPAPAAGEAVVRVHRIGICGTDYGGYLGKMPFYSYPRIPGHELGVEVLAVGPGVTNVKPGDRCSVEPYINCQTCYSCRRGFTNCCENHKTLGVMCDGGMAEKFLLPARKLHISAKLSYDQLALVETLAIGCHAAARIVYVGITQQDLTFPHAPHLHRRELTLMASRNAHSKDFARIIKLIEDGVIDTKPWITHHAKFDDLIATFPTWLKPESGVIKAIVDVV